MSYARFGANGSEVYLFAHVSGFIQCCACALNEVPEGGLFPPSWNTPTRGAAFDSDNPDRGFPKATYDEAISHVGLHVAAGHHVPDYVVERLTRERDTEGE